MCLLQIPPHHLPHRVSRQRVYEHNFLGPLIIHKPVSAMRQQTSFVQSVVPFYDKCDNSLAPMPVGDADDGGFPDAGTLIEHPLHHLRIDVVTAGDDEVMFATNEGQKAGRVQRAEITGIKPAGFERGARGIRFTPILAEKIGSTNRYRPDIILHIAQAREYRPAASRLSLAAKVRLAVGW